MVIQNSIREANTLSRGLEQRGREKCRQGLPEHCCVDRALLCNRRGVGDVLATGFIFLDRPVIALQKCRI